MTFRLILLLFLAPVSSIAGELEERAKIQATAGEHFVNRQFAALESMADEFRSDLSRTPSGILKLAEYYNGIANVGLDFPKTDQAAWAEAAATIDDWIESYPESATPYVAKATALMNRGWAYRGKGWARNVEDGDFDQYRNHAYFAAEFLLDHKDIAASDPHWYYVLLDSLRAVRADKAAYLELSTEALDRFPDYDPLYFKIAGYLSPKWFGSLPELEAFAQNAVARTKATRGAELYARIYWASGQLNRQEHAFQSAYVDWSTMISGMDAVIREYPDQWNINRFAYFACVKQDYATTRKYLELVVEPVAASHWDGAIMNYQRCRLNSGLPPSPQLPMP